MIARGDRDEKEAARGRQPGVNVGIARPVHVAMTRPPQLVALGGVPDRFDEGDQARITER